MSESLKKKFISYDDTNHIGISLYSGETYEARSGPAAASIPSTAACWDAVDRMRLLSCTQCAFGETSALGTSWWGPVMSRAWHDDVEHPTAAGHRALVTGLLGPVRQTLMP